MPRRRAAWLISGKPGMEAEFERYWTRCAAASPRVAVSRTVGMGEPPDTVVNGWSRDSARAWATMLVVQTQPARAELAAHLPTIVEVGAALRATSGTPSGV